jgi:ABC-2 type transport system permease protein
VSARNIFLGKLLGAEMVVFFGGLPGVAVLTYILSLSWLDVLLGLVLGILSSTLVSMIGLTIDCIRPFLNWTNEARAVKSNLNFVFTGFVTLVLIFLMVLAGMYLTSINFNATALTVAYFVIMIMANLVLWQIVQGKLEEWIFRMKS